MPADPSPAAPGPRLAVPDLALVVLIGADAIEAEAVDVTGFAERSFRAGELVAAGSFEGLLSLAGERLAAGQLTVVDASAANRAERQRLVRLAREHDVRPVAIALGEPVAGLEQDGFRRVHRLPSRAEAETAEVVLERRRSDLRHLTGPFDLIGDVHGCRAELEALLDRLGYTLTRDEEGRAVDAEHPAGRTAVFLGDLVDRGPDSPGVLRLAMGMVAAGHALCVAGNHDHKLGRFLEGRKVTVSHGLRESLDQLAGEPEEFRLRVHTFLDGLASHHLLDGGALVVCHAGLPERFHGRTSGRVHSTAMYGLSTGERDEHGLPVRAAWAADYRGSALVAYGHTPVPAAVFRNNTICLDTGCVFGGSLTALRYPERELVAVPAEGEWYPSGGCI